MLLDVTKEAMMLRVTQHKLGWANDYLNVAAERQPHPLGTASVPGEHGTKLVGLSLIECHQRLVHIGLRKHTIIF
jgi:hypothetical protein